MGRTSALPARPSPSTAPATHLRDLFRAGRPIVAVMATGALIRILAPLLADKRAEPPVVAVAEDGSVVVPLLGGHHGANDLARRIAGIVDGFAAVTTAGDLALGVALDAPPPGWVLENPEDAKQAMADLLAGASARSAGPAPWLQAGRIPFAADGSVRLTVSDEARPPRDGELLYRPKTLVLGIGAERNAPPDAAIALAEAVLSEAGVSPLSLAAVVSVDLKADEAAVHAVAAHFGVPVRVFSVRAAGGGDAAARKPLRRRLRRDRLPWRRRRRGARGRRHGGAAAGRQAQGPPRHRGARRGAGTPSMPPPSAARAARSSSSASARARTHGARPR